MSHHVGRALIHPNLTEEALCVVRGGNVNLHETRWNSAGLQHEPRERRGLRSDKVTTHDSLI